MDDPLFVKKISQPEFRRLRRSVNRRRQTRAGDSEAPEATWTAAAAAGTAPTSATSVGGSRRRRRHRRRLSAAEADSAVKLADAEVPSLPPTVS